MAEAFYCPIVDRMVSLKGEKEKICYWNVNGRCTFNARQEICRQIIPVVQSSPNI